jgi:hypothetical protein
MSEKILKMYNYKTNDFNLDPYKIYTCDVYSFTSIYLLGVKCENNFVYHAIGQNPLNLEKYQHQNKKVFGAFVQMLGIGGIVFHQLLLHSHIQQKIIILFFY